MRLTASFAVLCSSFFLASCIQKGTNPNDPYETFNRKVHQFNLAFDATILKPPARLYKAVVPGPMRKSINNAYNNVNMIPTVANDLLQGEFKYAIKDSWRFGINSTLGIAGFFDPAEKMGLAAHSNDLGLTLARWGNRQSPYLVIPFIGPSTVRDGMGMLFEYSLLTPYPYLDSGALTTGLLAFRYIDLRAQLFDTEKLMDEALDKYAFLRDAYLQHRNYLINGEETESNDETVYVEEDNANDAANGYVDE